MRISEWSQHHHPQPEALVDEIRARRGGDLLALDRALLWSEPLARGWNVYLKAVRSDLSVDRALRELAICTVALATSAHYEYHHHSPDFLAAGGSQSTLDALDTYIRSQGDVMPPTIIDDEALVVEYAFRMTREIRVQDELFEKLRQRFGTTHLVELTASIATYNMVARFLEALRIMPET